jgi:CheY-like chemotaxis protein
MPVKDGLTAAREIREWEEKNNKEPFCIVSLTAHAMKEDIKKSLDAGCNHHITKPVKKDFLLKFIRKYSRDC